MNSAAPLDHTVQQVFASIDDIVLAAQAGSPTAFAELHSTYSNRLYQTILSITRNPQDAEEALQETFLRAYLAIGTFEGRSKVYSWLTRIAVNTALMVLRKRRTRPEVLFDPQQDDQSETRFFDPEDPSPNPEEAYGLRQRQIKTLRAIRRLNPKLQAPVRLQMKHGWSLKEISQALDISEAAVKSRIYRARKRLSASIVTLSVPAVHHYSGACQGDLEIAKLGCTLPLALKI